MEYSLERFEIQNNEQQGDDMCEIMVEVTKFRVLTEGQRSLFDVHAKINEGSDLFAEMRNFR